MYATKSGIKQKQERKFITQNHIPIFKTFQVVVFISKKKINYSTFPSFGSSAPLFESS